MSRGPGWYARRLRAMSPAEVATRAQDKVHQLRWARERVRICSELPTLEEVGARAERRFTATLPEWTRDKVTTDARDGVVLAADELLAGHWTVLGTAVPSPHHPDWFLDPVTGRHAPADRYCFSIDQRDEEVTGNVKAVWELSRHHHVTVLAAAWWLTGEDRYAEAAAGQLRSWWTANPFLSGIHWTSGIELGLRLVAWAWTRRLLEGWSGAAALFEENPDAVRQIAWHQRYLDRFRSTGSSANNHLVAEACGRLVAACAFDWYEESAAWREDAARALATSLEDNTFASGINKELATDYHGFVAELGLVGAVEAERAGHPLPVRTWQLLEHTFDAMAALGDVTARPPRQGDGDEGRALLVDDPTSDAWDLVLASGAETVGETAWWPRTGGGVEPVVLSALAGGRAAAPEHAHARPERRPDVFADAGITLLRTPAGAGTETWCRCDGGPHGFGAMAAHGHADALSVEVRHDGVDVLADPGTYCYHGEPAWRSYFRSTLAHNTLEIDGTNSSREGGPFLWSSQATSTVELADATTWRARVTGHPGADAALVHRRTVHLDERPARSEGSSAPVELRITDEVTGDRGHDLALALHLGPEVTATLEQGPAGPLAQLTWTAEGRPVSATLHLAPALTWSAHRGESEPPLGWYSPGFGVKVPATTLVGRGRSTAGVPLGLDTTLLLPATTPLAASVGGGQA